MISKNAIRKIYDGAAACRQPVRIDFNKWSRIREKQISNQNKER